MLFYVQMRWNIEGRITLDELWELEKEEIKTARQTVESGMVKGLYKVAAQKRVIAIVDVASIEELDRTVLGRLPLREYLDVEVVWALRDYEGFAEDVMANYRV